MKSMFDLEKLRANLAALMKDKGAMSDNELARQTGINQTTISRLLKGKIADPGVDKLCKLADYFGVTLSQLIGEKPIKPERDYTELENMLDMLPEYRRNTVINVAQSLANEPEPPPYKTQ